MSSSNFSELKSRIVEWNIDDETALINKIQSFTNDYTNQCNSISTNLNNFSHNLDIVEIDFYNSMNSLKTISLHKFIEHVIDENEPLQGNTNTEEEPKILTAEERNNYQVQLIKNAVDISVNAIPVKEPKQAQQPGEENSEDDSASVASSRLLGNQITHFKKLKLPYLINSKDFMMTEYVGLVPEEKEEVQNEEKMNVTDAMRQVNNQGGNENEKEFIPIDNGDSNNNNQYIQPQYNYQQPPQYNYQQPQSVPVQPSMGKGGIPVPPPMNLKVPKSQPNNNVQNNNQNQMMNPAQQNNQAPIKNEQPADVRTMLMRQMQQRNNPQPQNNMFNENKVQQNNSQHVNARPVENTLFQSKTIVQNQMPNRVMRTGTVYNNGKKEVRLGDFVKGKSIFDDEDDEEDDDFDPTMRSRTIVDKNRFKQKPQMNPNPQMMNPNPQMMNPNPQIMNPNPQMMNSHQMVQQQLQQQLLNQQKGGQIKVEPKIPVKEEKKSNNLFEMDNDDVPNNIPLKKTKITNTKKLGANLAKIFDDDEEEEEDNLEVTKIEEKTKNLAEKLNQLSKKEEPKLPPKEIKKPSFFEEEEDQKIPIKKEEIKKPEKVIKRPTFFDDDEEDIKAPIKESKPEPQKQIQNINNNAPKKKVNLFDPLGGDPVQEVKHVPSKSVVGNPLPKKKNTFSIFEEEEESNDKKIEVNPSNPIIQKEPPKQKKGLLFGDDEEEVPKEKPVIKEPEKEKPKVEMFPQRKKTEPEKKLNAFEKMLEQKKQEELENQKKKDEVQIKKVDFNSRFSDIQNLLSGRLSNAVNGSAFMMNPEARIQSVAQEEVNNENPNPSSDVNNEGENVKNNPEEIKPPEPEKKLEQTLSTQKVIQKKKPKKKAFGLPPSNDDKPKPAPSNPQKEEVKIVPVSNPQSQVVNKPTNPAPAKKKPQNKTIDPLSNISSSTTNTMRKSEVPTHQKAITNDPLSALGGNDLQSHRKTMVAQQPKIEIKKPNLKNLFDEDEDIDILSSNQPKISQTHTKAASTAMFATNTFGKSTSNDSNMRDSNIFSSQKRMSNIFGDEEDDRLSIRISSLPQPTNNTQPQRQTSNTITNSTSSNKPKPNDKRLQFLFDDDD